MSENNNRNPNCTLGRNQYDCALIWNSGCAHCGWFLPEIQRRKALLKTEGLTLRPDGRQTLDVTPPDYVPDPDTEEGTENG